jgi:4-amino-4-deoxy-L-arabinose transferase-like glycosyltransferase
VLYSENALAPPIPETTLDKLTLGLRPYLLLSLLCLILYAPGLSSVPPLDRDESRFVQATRQMLQTDDFVRIRFQDGMRAKKPVGAYWLQAASVSAFSTPDSRAMWPYRLPGALAAWAAALMTFAFGRSLVGRQAAFLAGIMLAGSVLLVSEAHQAKTDALLLACAVLAQGVLGRFYLAGRAKDIAGTLTMAIPPGFRAPTPGIVEALLFWLAQGAAILVKGPIVPAISLLTIAALAISDRSLRWLRPMRPVLGILVAAAVAAPWFVAISRATDGAFVGDAIKTDLLPKLLGAQESHGGWPGYYLLLSLATFWPASLLIWPAMSRVWGQRHRLPFRYLLGWAVPAWIMFELVPTKLPHYVLPTYPAIALMTGAMVVEGAGLFRRAGARLFYVLWIVIGLALAAAVIYLPIRFGGGFAPGLMPVAAGIVLATLLPMVLAVRGRTVEAALALALTAAATYPGVFSQLMPRLTDLWVAPAVAREVRDLGATRPVAVAGYSEPSIVVMLGTRTLLTGGAGAAAYLAAHPHRLAVVSDADRAGFMTGIARQGLTVRPLGRVTGFNYSKGRPVALTLFGRTQP